MSNTLLKKIALIAIAIFSFNAYAAPVNVNSADVETLAASLKGVGTKKAQAIIDYRDTHGDFATAMDLTAVKGIGEKTILSNQNDIALSSEELSTKVAKQNTAQ